MTCWFDAWMHNDAPHLGAALATAVARTANRARPLWRRLLNPVPLAMLRPHERWRRRLVLAVLAVVVAALVVAVGPLREPLLALEPIRDSGAAEVAPLLAYALLALLVARNGPTLPVCTFGQSAGGHLALLVAVQRAGGVSCVINQAGPTDAASLPTQGAYDAASGGTQTNLPKVVYNLMVAAFGQENLPGFSPAQSVAPGLTGARVLSVTSAHDSLVPYEQMTLLRDRIRATDLTAHVETMQLEAGEQPFAHAPVSQSALTSYFRAERALVAPFAPAPAP